MKENQNPTINENQNFEKDNHLVKQIDASEISEEKIMNKTVLVVFVILILLGIGTGYILSVKTNNSGSTSTTTSTSTDKKVVGSSDTKTFKDSAEGTLEKGGFDGEGTHKLVREGGDSQTVYLISSVIDLDQYIGKKIKVWGQTQAAQKAAWLMDVGKVEVE